MIIQSKKVWVANNFNPLQIEIENEKIVAVYPYGTKEVDHDYGSLRVLPGFIDIHSHGAYGFDTNDGKEEGLRNWIKRLPADEGVTSFLPTTITQSVEVLSNAVANVAKVVRDGYEGANVLGINFEGPYLDMKYKGAQPEEHILPTSVEQFKMYQDKADGLIKIITLAPEHDENMQLTKYCSQNGVVVSLGHSSATYETAVVAAANGAKLLTHVYNGMTPYGHRQLGLVGAAFRIRDMYGEIIADGYHSTPEAVNNYFHVKGADHAVMISDSLRPKGLPKGEYTSGGAAIVITEEGTAKLLGTDTLAGSTLRVNKGLQVLIEKCLVDVASAINSCTLNPARLLRIDDHKGKIAAGYDADIVVLEDNYDVHQTYVGGKAFK
ncbi:MAG TPA: N-acetylglucosamine-6-phosphate deacetylase [Erysipelotrichaceae bacterium]|jgi:N-acetylglucosamine-6-phosphate deacetylase|nr:N-acetylglucosamine-6-phosphate deacetylase [Erysipelotrichaceae bacterium]HQA85631.1 N-acetylglucosamine-6-phosphate deacetylase [Erysipelotrichaceae bacterium]